MLPGFRFRISHLLERPSISELAADPVYQGFVLPELQAERARAERLAARLSELGIEEEME